MKHLPERLERTLMYNLALMPVLSMVCRYLTDFSLFGPIWLAAQSLVICFLAMLPVYVGSYRQEDVLIREGGANRGNDPDPDRETRHELVRTGHRYSIRIPAFLIFLALSIAAACIVPEAQFRGHFFFRLLFVFLMMTHQFIAMATLAPDYCFWTQLPGILLGFVCYLILALIMRFVPGDYGPLPLLIGLCALAFLFVGGVCLNRQSIRFSLNDLGRRPPRAVSRRNRRIVIVFIAAIALISFVGPIRQGAVWLLNKVLYGIRWIFSDHSAPEAADESAALSLGDMELGYATEIESYQPQSDLSLDNAMGSGLAYIVLGLVALGVFFLLYDLDKRISAWLEKFAQNSGEGYYDEKEKLDKGSEKKRSLRELMASGVKKLLTRPPAWESLSGREKARRIVSDLYKKRSRRVRMIRSRTAKEALGKMGLKKEQVRDLSRAYDTARYSSGEVDGGDMDTLRKEIKP